MIRELSERIPGTTALAPIKCGRPTPNWSKPKVPRGNELVALVSLIRRVAGIDQALTSYDKTVDRTSPTGSGNARPGPA